VAMSVRTDQTISGDAATAISPRAIAGAPASISTASTLQRARPRTHPKQVSVP
jgi:hypothetical protein